MLNIYQVEIVKEDSTEWEIFITPTSNYTQAVEEARDYFIMDGDNMYSEEDEFKLYNITGLKINGYTLNAIEE